MVEISQVHHRLWFFDVFPDHPSPYPGECLSGYLLRLAEVNGFVSFWDMVADLFPVFWKRDQISLLRWEYPVDDWGRIPLRTQLSVTDLRKLTVAPWVEKFRPLPMVTRAGQKSPGHFLRGVVNPELRVCPLCLQVQPYLRLMWRLAPVKACLDHACLLQTQCHQCGTPLTVLGSKHRHLHCVVCDADWRTLPVDTAAEDLLTAHQRLQADMEVLLDPDVRLVNDTVGEPQEALGLKFRYLRHQAGQSARAMAQQMGVRSEAITALELGRHTTISFYQSYLEALSISWSDFAALEVPQEFVQRLAEPHLLHLRLCPAPECPNHQPPPGLGVKLLNNFPDRQRAQLGCSACGRTFTRTYDGQLIVRRHLSIHPGELPTVTKPAEEVTRLVEMGLQGLENYQIARQLGWGQKTVRMYWISLGLEEQVHQAQAQRRGQKKEELYAALCDHVERILQSLIEEDSKITLYCVSHALGHEKGYLRNHPDLKNHVLEVAQKHNAQVKERRYEAFLARILQALEEARKSEKPMTIYNIVQQAGLSYEQAHNSYPELVAMLRQEVAGHRTQIKAARTQARCAQIDEAAARLVAHAVPLTQKAILEEAGLDKNKISYEPVARALVRRWVDDFSAND